MKDGIWEENTTDNIVLDSWRSGGETNAVRKYMDGWLHSTAKSFHSSRSLNGPTQSLLPHETAGDTNGMDYNIFDSLGSSHGQGISPLSKILFLNSDR